MKIIYLEWEDALGHSSWMSKNELDDWISDNTAIIKQIGWLYKETKRYIVLISRLDGNDDEYTGGYGMAQRIPKAWIKKRKVIKL